MSNIQGEIGRTMKVKWLVMALRYLSIFALGAQMGLVNACTRSSRASGNTVLHTTISADGQIVAALWNAGSEQQVLCVRHLATDTRWRSVKAPALTQSIRFASQGHDLLLTYAVPAINREVLARLDMDRPGADPVKVYEAEDLAFPVEIGPGLILVRTRKPTDPKGPKLYYLSGYHWILIGPGNQVKKVGPDPVLPYNAPNVVGSGFFWVEEQTGAKKEAHPLVLSYPLPGGTAPVFSRERLDKNTFTVRCDATANRCLRKYLTNDGQRPAVPYIYDVEVLLGSQRCKLPGVAGWLDSFSITPDGNAAVLSTAAGSDKPRHVVAIKFNPQQCSPTSIQHIHFEEK